MSAKQDGPSGSSSTLLTRRTAITGALGATALLAATRSTAAQEASPAPDAVSYLFLQACESGTATPAGDAEGAYDLTLAHASGQTLFFADRPARLAGIVPTAAFLDDLAAAAGDPPNAALAFSPEGTSDDVDVAVIELTAPQHDAEAGTIGYRVRLIDVVRDQDDAAAEGETIAPVTELPATFGRATLFIDALSAGADLPMLMVNFNHPTRLIGIWKKPPRD
jgi:hypothetical protein